MSTVHVPRALRGRVLPHYTLAEIRALISYERATAPVAIEQDAFEQLLYDAVAADPRTPRALIFERLNRRYQVTDATSARA